MHLVWDAVNTSNLTGRLGGYRIRWWPTGFVGDMDSLMPHVRSMGYNNDKPYSQVNKMLVEHTSGLGYDVRSAGPEPTI
jgi:hypothetical protein